MIASSVMQFEWITPNQAGQAFYLHLSHPIPIPRLLRS